MRIAVVGAGGVGGYYGGILARAGNDVGLLARGEHGRALREHGLEIRAPGESFRAAVRVSEDVGQLGPADLAIVATKSYSLAAVVPAVRSLAQAGAIVLPLLNGVEAIDALIAGGVPRKNVLGGLTVVSSVRVAPGIIERKSPFCSVTVGEPEKGLSERAERIAALFRAAGVEARASADIEVDLWRKFLLIATMSAACGLVRGPLGAVRSRPLGPLLIERLVREIVAVARARGIALPEGEEERILAQIQAMPPALKPSFVLDLESGGPNELDVLSGAVSRFGRAAGILTPVHDTATTALAAASS